MHTTVWSMCHLLSQVLWTANTLTLYTLTSVGIFSILFSKHFLRCQPGEFVQQSRASLVGDQLLYSPNLNVWFRGDMVRRNSMPVTLRGQRVKMTSDYQAMIIQEPAEGEREYHREGRWGVVHSRCSLFAIFFFKSIFILLFPSTTNTWLNGQLFAWIENYKI